MSAPQPSDHVTRRESEARSLDLVQRIIISGLVAVVFRTFSAVLAAYLAIRGDQDLPPSSVIGLWVMTGVLGLATAATILLVNRRRPYSPWVLLGLLPLVISAPGFWANTHSAPAHDGPRPLSRIEICFRSLCEAGGDCSRDTMRRAEGLIVPALHTLDIAH